MSRDTFGGHKICGPGWSTNQKVKDAAKHPTTEQSPTTKIIQPQTSIELRLRNAEGEKRVKSNEYFRGNLNWKKEEIKYCKIRSWNELMLLAWGTIKWIFSSTVLINTRKGGTLGRDYVEKY